MQVGSGRVLAYCPVGIAATMTAKSPAESTLNDMLAVLEADGYAIEKVAASNDYLPAIAQSPPDLVLLPIGFPESEQLLQALVGLEDAPPIMVCGGVEQSDMAGKMMQAGANEYFLASDGEHKLLRPLVDRTIASHRDLELLRVEQARLKHDLAHVEEDRNAAFEVQQRLLPEPQACGDISFSYHLQPRAGMSGDSVNCFYLSDGRLLFYLADVAGHGVLGGVVTTALTVTAKNLADPAFSAGGQSSSDLLQWFNRAMLALELDQHVTMFLGVIDVTESSLEYSSAAHFPGTILCQDGACHYLELGGLPLGVCETSYETQKITLSPVFELILFSDGVLEILPRESMKNRENRLITLVESGSRSISALSAELNLQGRSEVPDDIAVLTLKRNLSLP